MHRLISGRFVLTFLLLGLLKTVQAQSVGSAGTIQGVVLDPSGAVVAGATVEIHHPITGYRRDATTNTSGAFKFQQVPQNSYHLQVDAPGFERWEQDVLVRSNLPMDVKATLTLAGSASSVTVEASGSDLLENVPYAHNDVGEAALARLPLSSPGSSLSEAIMMSSPGVVGDSNGFFHPLGDHAQTSYVVDGQPISDQQSKNFSTQIPANAMQSLELITGGPNAEYGDKTSLVVNATTRSGIGATRPTGSFQVQYGSFGSIDEEATLSSGTSKFGNFLAFNMLRSGRFLDTPEFDPMHAIGNNGAIFDHVDWQPNNKDMFHLVAYGIRNWFQTPNTYDQANQDQKQRVITFNAAPGYNHTFSPETLLTLNAFVRHDQVNYYASRDPFDDTPATVSQLRFLTNYGISGSLSYVHGKHNLKVGTRIQQTRLDEKFSLGITDPSQNPVCVDANGVPQLLPTTTDPTECEGLGFVPNPTLLPGLVPYDLSRGGSPYQFYSKGKVNEYGFYTQDTITLGGLNISLGLRGDLYYGLSHANSVQPRAGLAYQFKKTGTVLRAAYSRTFETPYNENLLLSSTTGIGGLGAGNQATEPLRPGGRNQYNIGFQQAITKYVLVDADYFWKYTRNGYDFDVLFTTPIAFPISWYKSSIDGLGVRVSTIDIKGFQAYTTMGHTRARFFGPENGGIIFESPINNVFRIDHDQAFQQTTNLRYTWKKPAVWASFIWRYSSGTVAGAVTDLQDALGLTADQQAQIGFYCGDRYATITDPITSCDSRRYGATRLNIPAEGTYNADHNPPRITSRNVFDIQIGDDRLIKRDHYTMSARFTITNLTNVAGLYNFLSTFSGTHFLAPRSYMGTVGFTF
jgi:hypothetical protein